jgi:hypothetical protein
MSVRVDARRRVSSSRFSGAIPKSAIAADSFVPFITPPQCGVRAARNETSGEPQTFSSGTHMIHGSTPLDTLLLPAPPAALVRELRLFFGVSLCAYATPTAGQPCQDARPGVCNAPGPLWPIARKRRHRPFRKKSPEHCDTECRPVLSFSLHRLTANAQEARPSRPLWLSWEWRDGAALTSGELSHPLTLALAHCHAAGSSQMRRDETAVLEQAEAALTITTEHGIPQ